MSVWSRKIGREVLRLACWNTDGVRCRKPELEQFFSEHCVDICFLNHMHLELGRDLRFATLVTGRTGRLCKEAQRSLFAQPQIICCASLGSPAPGGYCRTPSVGDQTSAARVGLYLPHTTVDLVGSAWVPEQLIVLIGTSQRKARGMEF
jgi:hypothetical protein